jgi:hypothetical protein
MKYVDKINEIVGTFKKKFHYDCEVPFAVLSGDNRAIEDFRRTVEKCINDDFDYTIELYGTVPLPKGNPNDILID